MTAPWWRDAAVYQVYPRSFADADGDGEGDLAGIRSRLQHIRDLGADAVWFAPWYPSAGADGGYDVADYRAIEPRLGTLAEAEQLIAEARAQGLRTIVDVVPNHLATTHAWFAEALAAGPGSRARERFLFRPGRGPDGAEPPNDWQSAFGGPAWSRVHEPDGAPGEWYLHLFAPAQADLNWEHPDVRAEFEDVLRFWLRRGVSGIRVDSATMIAKDPALPPVPARPGPGEHPYVDRDAVHDVYRSWRRVVEEFGDDRILVGEVWLGDGGRLAAYLRPDELHTAFNFDLMSQPWDAEAVRASISATLAHHGLVGAPATWVLSNHDVTRPVTRFGRAETAFHPARRRAGVPTDVTLGTRRARAAALLVAALPGSLYIYQGDELGLPEVEELSPEERRDPIFAQTRGTDPGRDGCRVPLPWEGDAPPYGFSRAGTRTWLPQPAGWAALTVAAQRRDPGSMLLLYRRALDLRRSLTAGRGEELTWVDVAPGVLAFDRPGAFRCAVNFSDAAVALDGWDVLLASEPLTESLLAPGTAVWAVPAW
ncbi:glycoside hydrolase family 13 protein [Georgenia sp. AZ-5]|uniref:glycoside hydrolase family 13 protein n=1 Tax=Georgenia sp. AZ-5 TaxID=3367526 RepID=UPI003754EC30